MSQKYLRKKFKKGITKKKTSNFNKHIHKVLKQLFIGEITISKKAMKVMNSILLDFFDRISLEAGQLVKLSKRKTIQAIDIQTAVKFVIPNGGLYGL